MIESDDDEPQLCPTTLAVLQEFLKEKQQREDCLKNIDKNTEILNVSFDENWQLSQFWYNDETTNVIVKGAINSTPINGKIALISCPTLYNSLKKNCGERQVTLFEYDERFKIYGSDFISYDYNSPLNIPKSLSNFFDLVIADPPFLSNECLRKTAVTIKFLCRQYIVVCTGAFMADAAYDLLGVQICDFIPHHKNNLANEFRCYANFDFDSALK